MSLFQMSVAGGVLILFIVVIRALAIHRLPKTTFLALWMIAALRLLLPFSIPLPFNIHIGLDVFSDVVQELPSGNIASTLPGDSPPSYDIGTAVPSPATEHISTFEILWLVGVLLLAIYFSISYFRSMRKFRMSIPDNTPYIQNWLTAHQISRPLAVRSSDLISSPLTYGILHPVILLPKKLDRNDQAALKYVLTHEYVHIRRFDAITKILFAAVLCIHWFNPLVWVMYVLANRDMELSCDAWVIRMLGEKNRSSYALMLIKMEERRSGMSALCSHLGKNAISERIEAIMKFKKTSILAYAFALVLVVGATTAFATSTGAWREFDLDDLNLTEGHTGTETDNMKIVDSEDIPDQVKDLDQFDLTEGQVGTQSNGMKMIDPSDTRGQILDTDDLNLVEGNVGTETSSMKMFEYTPEEWNDIQQKIDNGELVWQY
ncbi:M56 family metallopeptidase [Pseudoflavonifractor phocaeensis]|uniref:M56 family metallopeptidase n=1 Tax=Pseudoflavonifractor phocaeensis TaxID=1870988 RepID=UPI00195974DA|nr:M56 family metallopeptidase [Pseudoflavonifractor phocaeensis]MBM6924600.1 M56 family metallopeptidase [Pseudoflavonifractor phocaeensis]